jgi:uncharacterized protein YjbI with pentapeptide repeats
MERQYSNINVEYPIVPREEFFAVQDVIKEKLDKHYFWIKSDGKTGKVAAFTAMDLRGHDFNDKDLRYVRFDSCDLRGVVFDNSMLSKVDFFDANLTKASLRNCDLVGTSFYKATLVYADLTGSNLFKANLRNADIRYAHIDFTSFPLSCGSLNLKIDIGKACQFLYHLCSMKCDDEEFMAIRESLLPFANRFHRVEEVGFLEAEG